MVLAVLKAAIRLRRVWQQAAIPTRNSIRKANCNPLGELSMTMMRVAVTAEIKTLGENGIRTSAFFGTQFAGRLGKASVITILARIRHGR